MKVQTNNRQLAFLIQLVNDVASKVQNSKLNEIFEESNNCTIVIFYMVYENIWRIMLKSSYIPLKQWSVLIVWLSQHTAMPFKIVKT